MLCALIMAGGKGERFWPLSTDKKPKQFLKLLGEETMIQMSVNRMIPLIPINRIFVVTDKKYVHLVREQLPHLPLQNIILEPLGRNTAPCIGLSAFIIQRYYQNASIIVVPSDHLIVDEDRFRETINLGYRFTEENEDVIVTIGMKPDRPETGYGYIKIDTVQAVLGNNNIHKVEKFVEKPDLDKATEYIHDKNYFWNCGMFLWKCSTILKLIEKYLKETYEVLNEIAATSEGEFEVCLNKKYPEVESISIDYAIMEKAENIYIIPSDFGWDDIGSWQAVERYRLKDCNNNICVGRTQNIHSNNNVIFSSEKHIVVVGIDNVFVVESDDAIYIGKKEDLSKIKDIKKIIA
jgi:mannose-1-phosphate guanylyltransferase